MDRNVLLILFFSTILPVRLPAQTEMFAPMKDAIKAGSAKELVKYLNQTVEINLEGNSSNYSKVQSEFVFRDFFKKHPVTDFNILHTGSSKGGLHFAIGRYQSGDTSYNVVIRIKEVEGSNLIHEINFVKE